jgi:hydroxymethylbilane synthase
MTKLTIATRQSPMALAQAQAVQQALVQYYPTLDCQLLPMTTEGDRQLSVLLSTVGGKGLFLKELEHALLDGRADLAVHSLKDVTVDLPPGLVLAAFCERIETRDAFVSPSIASFADLPRGAVLGTSSLRRACLAKGLRPDLKVQPLRGNVQTRLAKLANGDYDAIILSAAGLARVGLQEQIREYLAPELFLPAVGQGALAIECLASNQAVLELISVLDHAPTRACVLAERSLNRALQGGCHVPIAGYASWQAGRLHLQALVGKVDGSLILRAEAEDAGDAPEALGVEVAAALLAKGAATILHDLYHQQ